MTKSPSSFAVGRLAVVTFDWLPAWMLATWGTTWLATPAFDRLAARGVTLDAVMAAGDDLGATLEAVMGPASRTLGSLTQRASLLATDTPAVARGALSQAFRDVVEEPAEATEGCAEEEADTALGAVFSAAAEGVLAMAGDPCLLWCHAGSLGVCWDAPLEFRDSLVDEDDPTPPRSAAIPCSAVTAEEDPDRILGIRQAFAGQVMLADRMLGDLLEILDSVEGDPWTIVVAGLRGMPLGLHGDLGVPASGVGDLLPYGDLVQMPVIIADSQGRMAGQRYGGLLAAEDLGGFLEDCLTGHDSSRLSGLLDRWSCPARDQVVSTTKRGRSLATPQWRLLVEAAAENAGQAPGVTRLFAKPDDFFEQVDVADRCSNVVEDLERHLRDEEASGGPPENR